MDTAIDRGEEILSRIAELEVERGRIEAETASLMLEFADLRRVQAEATTTRGSATCRPGSQLTSWPSPCTSPLARSSPGSRTRAAFAV